ncbi:hypothetical protein [Pannonibacter phragmitetus]|nr:hypothetical protein [Pannonibacter phragmitetus]
MFSQTPARQTPVRQTPVHPSRKPLQAVLRDRAVRLKISTGALLLALLLGGTALPPSAFAQRQEDLTIPQDMTRYIGPVVAERDDLRQALTHELAEKEPSRAGKLITTLVNRTATAGGWPETYAVIAAQAAPLMERLEGVSLTPFCSISLSLPAMPESPPSRMPCCGRWLKGRRRTRRRTPAATTARW